MLEKMRKEAAKYRRENPIDAGGYVVLFRSFLVTETPVAEGWIRYLDRPAAFLPGKSFAVGADGSVWAAEGGNDYDGAQAWVPYDGQV